jgi:hypothetical protein
MEQKMRKPNLTKEILNEIIEDDFFLASWKLHAFENSAKIQIIVDYCREQGVPARKIKDILIIALAEFSEVDLSENLDSEKASQTLRGIKGLVRLEDGE